MRVISTSKGFVLIFPDEDDLKGVISHLSILLEFKQKQKALKYLIWPARYIVIDKRIPEEEAKKELDVGVY